MGKIHDLDELFGQDDPIQVKLQGKTYILRRPDSFSPREMNRFENLMERSRELQGEDEEKFTDEQADELEEVTREAVEILNPRLAEATSFLHHVNILVYHANKVRESAGAEKKRTGLSSTGETSTPD